MLPYWLKKMVRPAGLEPATYGLEGRCSIQLSYERTNHESRYKNHTLLHVGTISFKVSIVKFVAVYGD